MRMKSAAILITLFFSIGGTTNLLHANNGTNYTIYSMFIYNFIKYLEWPEKNEKIIIAVWNNASAAGELEKMAKAKSNPAREIVIKNISDEQDLMNAHMIFVPANSSSEFIRISDKLKNRPIVVVTEEPDLTEKGAGLSFKKVSDKIKFQINNRVLKSGGLKVASALEGLAIK